MTRSIISQRALRVSYFSSVTDNRPELRSFNSFDAFLVALNQPIIVSSVSWVEWRELQRLKELGDTAATAEISRIKKPIKPYSPAIFEGTRCNANVTRVEFVAFDFDNIPATIEGVTESIRTHGWRGAVYSTISHVGDGKKGRYRALIELTRSVTRAEYERMHAYLAAEVFTG
jgi:hypothetical protein